MNGRRKSDGRVVPKRAANKEDGAPSSAERKEGRRSAKGNSVQTSRHRAQERARLNERLDRVRQKASEDKALRFTTLWHHIYDTGRLREAYFGLERRSAPGVDGVTWQTYGEDLEANLADLSARLKRGAYRAKPVRRVHIPKGDGGERALGVPTVEDKIVQRATVEVLEAIYEQDFLGFSYGFRPDRSQHMALDAVAVGIERQKVRWVLDADIRGFFDAISHEWLVKFIEHRIADQRVVRHVKKWLKAGVLEDGIKVESSAGTPQGGSISPLLANVYLHYVFDLWAHQWRRRHGHGEVIIVRYADDFIVGFEHKADAERFQQELAERLAQFELELHPDKTRLIRFGRSAEDDEHEGGGGKPPTFEFLGFTHYCGRTRRGHFVVKRRTSSKRMRRRLAELKDQLRRNRHRPIPDQGAWLQRALQGWYGYHAVPFNYPALERFRNQLVRRWYAALRRRSQRTKLNWERMGRLARRWLPPPRILHPFPSERLAARTRGRSPVR